MQQFAKALKFEIVVAVGAVATVLLMLSAIQFISAKTLATPALAQGKPCNSCHTSSTPSKSDLKN